MKVNEDVVAESSTRRTQAERTAAIEGGLAKAEEAQAATAPPSG